MENLSNQHQNTQQCRKMSFFKGGNMNCTNDGSDEWNSESFDTSREFSLARKPQQCGVHLAVGPLKVEEEASEFPIHVIRKEKKIKDVVKLCVLPFLPAKSLVKFRAVSKEWDQWITSPLLAYEQSFSCQSFSGYFYQDMMGGYIMFLSLDRSTNGVPCPSLRFLPENMRILSSSSGLLLCQGWESYYVCNPATKVWRMLSLPQYYHGDEPAVALAFEPSRRNIEESYHVVCAFPLLGQSDIGFEIFSSESNSWRCSSAYCTELENTNLVSGGLYMKGVAYWQTKSNEVLAFDLKNDVYAILYLPTEIGRHGSLTQMEGELCYVTAHNECGNVFLIDVYGGMDMSLMRSISINLGIERTFTQACKVLPCVNSDAVVIQAGAFVYFYHLREQKVESLLSPVAELSGIRFLPYINSLVMLHELKDSSSDV